MTIRTALNGQVLIAEESTYGLANTTSMTALPYREDDLGAEPDYLESDAVYAGRRMLLADQVDIGMWKVGGSLGFEFNNKGRGLLFKHMFGAVSTTGPVNSLYTHTFTPGDLSAKSLTIQLGIVDSTTGTVRPYTYTGCKFTGWELGCKTGENATLGVDVVARQEIVLWTLADGVTTSGSATVTSAIGGFSASDTGKPISSSTTAIPALSYIGTVVDSNTITLSSSSFTNTPVNATATTSSNLLTMGVALATASYASTILPVNFNSCSVSIAGSNYKAQEVTLKAANGLADDRVFLGQNVIDEPLEAELREYTGSINSEYFDDTAYHRFLTGVPASTVLNFNRGSSTAAITMTKTQYRGTTAKLDGTSIVKQDLPFKALGGTTDALGISAVLVDGDATP